LYIEEEKDKVFLPCFVGQLKSFDEYMNLQLINSEEWIKDTFKGVLGEILLR
jgi:small nuclear ribonucleoprotein (snRNP)-like protein